jgi:hypothetical protein
MEPEPLDYRNPSTVRQARADLLPKLAIAAAVLLIVSVTCCIVTWTKPGRFIFVPLGDVGGGFKSYAGWLEWIEYAPWEAPRGDYPQWGVHWGVVFVVEMLPVLVYAMRRWRPRAPVA